MTAKTVMIVAGEASGDLLGAHAMASLKKEMPDVRFIGVGGPAMAAEGLDSLFPLSDLAFMGLLEVLPQLPHLFKRLAQLTRVAQEEEIDLLLTVDAQAFSVRLARRIKAALGVPCVQYVAPKVWAWRPRRVQKLVGIFDHIFTILPFEAPYFETYGLSTTFVGHPVLARLQAYVPQEVTPVASPTLALFPGSRVSEVQRHWPIMVETFQQLRAEIPDLQAVVPLPDDSSRLRAFMYPLPDGITLVSAATRFDVLKTCRAALAKSGTGNLELAVLGVPMIVGYRLHALTYYIAKFLVHVPYISLVNWVAGQKIVPEYIQQDFTPVRLLPPLLDLLTDDQHWLAQASSLENVRQKLQTASAEEELGTVLVDIMAASKA